MFFVVGSSVRVLKAAAFKRFSVRPCWSPILLKFQNSIAGDFQCIFNEISEHVFYKTTMNWYFRTKKGRCKYWSSIVSVRYHFRGVMFKKRLCSRKRNKNLAFFVGKGKCFFFQKPRCVLQKYWLVKLFHERSPKNSPM